MSAGMAGRAAIPPQLLPGQEFREPALHRDNMSNVHVYTSDFKLLITNPMVRSSIWTTKGAVGAGTRLDD